MDGSLDHMTFGHYQHALVLSWVVSNVTCGLPFFCPCKIVDVMLMNGFGGIRFGSFGYCCIGCALF